MTEPLHECSCCGKENPRKTLYPYPFFESGFGFNSVSMILVCDNCKESDHEYAKYGRKSKAQWMDYMTVAPAWKDKIPHHCWQCEKKLDPVDIWLFQSFRNPNTCLIAAIVCGGLSTEIRP